jgi:hypothetical protein
MREMELTTVVPSIDKERAEVAMNAGPGTCSNALLLTMTGELYGRPDDGG